MTGWRIGWLLGPKAFVDACTALVTHSTQCPNAFAQVGATEALNGPQKFVGEMLAEYRRRRDFVHGALKSIPGLSCVEPAGGFYVFPNVGRYLGGSVSTAVRLSERLLADQKVAVVAGEGFGTPGYIRIAFARPMDELREGVTRITAFLAGLRGD